MSCEAGENCQYCHTRTEQQFHPGLDVSGVDGSDLVFNKHRPVVPGLLVSRPEYTAATRRALRC